MYSYGSPHTAAQKQDDQHERTFSSYVRIQVVVLKTYLGRWMIGRSGERGSGISVLPARYDDDDDIHCKLFVLIKVSHAPLVRLRIHWLYTLQRSKTPPLSKGASWVWHWTAFNSETPVLQIWRVLCTIS